MRLFLLWKLPAAWFMGVRVESCTPQRAVVCLPYGWRSQNPFRSTYFAAQCAAGELSTGLLALVALQERDPVSMLVLRIEAEFLKKADQALLFTCEEGDLVESALDETFRTRQAQVVRLSTVGRLPDGTEAARMWITWSFKARAAKRLARKEGLL
ncbi:MAG: DUF4442 domain-containing protein [Saprospiraceae bacterium]|nr:DUF4442 domain-containing protein [Saprospiraceae bacterium]